MLSDDGKVFYRAGNPGCIRFPISHSPTRSRKIKFPISLVTAVTFHLIFEIYFAIYITGKVNEHGRGIRRFNRQKRKNQA
jgi:hypothetical protein